MSQIIPIDKFQTVFKVIKQYGGLKGTFLQLLRRDEIKLGTVVGVDKYGNKYYENKSFFYGRNRWVDYADKYGFEYDASQVPAEWYGWLHYKTDLVPDKDPNRPKYKWMKDHTQNLSGTPHQYVPYSTTQPKVQSWKPPKKA